MKRSRVICCSRNTERMRKSVSRKDVFPKLLAKVGKISSLTSERKLDPLTGNPLANVVGVD